MKNNLITVKCNKLAVHNYSNLCSAVLDIASTYRPITVVDVTVVVRIKVKVKERIAVSGIPSHSYGTSLAIWDHTVLPATRHK